MKKQVIFFIMLIFLSNSVLSASCQGSAERCDGKNLYICVNGQEFGPYQVAGKCNSQTVPDTECTEDSDCGNGKVCLDSLCKFKTSSGTEWIWAALALLILIIIVFLSLIIIILIRRKKSRKNILENPYKNLQLNQSDFSKSNDINSSP